MKNRMKVMGSIAVAVFSQQNLTLDGIGAVWPRTVAA